MNMNRVANVALRRPRFKALVALEAKCDSRSGHFSGSEQRDGSRIGAGRRYVTSFHFHTLRFC